MFKKISLGISLVIFLVYSIIGIKLMFSFFINVMGTLGIVIAPILAVVWIGLIMYLVFRYFCFINPAIEANDEKVN